MKETNLEIINHCLQGVMDSSDMMNLFCFFKMKRLYNQQRKRLNLLMKEFRYFSDMYIEKYNEIPKVSSFQQVFSYATKLDDTLVREAINAWIDWETKQIELCCCLLKHCDCINEKKMLKKCLYFSELFLKIAKHNKVKYVHNITTPSPKNK